MTATDDTVDRTMYASPVPKALNDPGRIYSETLPDSTVVLDAESMHYHTLNTTAAHVWSLCDGKRSVSDIANQLRLQGFDVPDDAVALAVAELGDADLLQTTPALGESRFHRRRVLKLAAAGLIGAGAMPLVQSITVPNSASAQTGSCCEIGAACGTVTAGVCISALGLLGVDVGICVLQETCLLSCTDDSYVCILGTCVLGICCDITVGGVSIC
jgi:hypothetical protein